MNAEMASSDVRTPPTRAGGLGVIAVVNQKGGVGKTTTAVNLAAGLAREGQRVLLIDLDPQGNATFISGLGVRGYASMAEVLSGVSTLDDIIQPTRVKGMSVAGSDDRLHGTVEEMHARTGTEYRLAEALNAAAWEGEWVIIDNHPSIDPLIVNSLTACGRILIPIQPEPLPLMGLRTMIDYIHHHRGAEVDWRIVLTMVGGHGRERQAEIASILEPVAERIFKTRIRRSEAIVRSQMDRDDMVPAVTGGQFYQGSLDYRALTNEIMLLWQHLL